MDTTQIITPRMLDAGIAAYGEDSPEAAEMCKAMYLVSTALSHGRLSPVFTAMRDAKPEAE